MQNDRKVTKSANDRPPDLCVEFDLILTIYYKLFIEY